MTCILCDVWFISVVTVDEFYICMLFEFWCEDVASISWIFILFTCIIALIEIGHYIVRSLTLFLHKRLFPSKKHHFPKIHWAKVIWSKDILPSKSLPMWRMMLGKLPTDEILASRGCNLPSIALYVFPNKNHPFTFSLNVIMQLKYGDG